MLFVKVSHALLLEGDAKGNVNIKAHGAVCTLERRID
jgi:hypothetical protein